MHIAIGPPDEMLFTGNDIGYLIDAGGSAVFKKAACRKPIYYAWCRSQFGA